jgi:hypothetical protein
MAWLLAAWPWLVGLGLLAILAVAFAQWPLRLEASGKAQGKADGSWVLACGLSISVASLALVWARGVSPQFTVLLFGRKLRWKPKPRPGRAEAPTTDPQPKRSSSWLVKRLDPLGLALQLVEERRHLRLRRLVLELSYGFRDPLLTGRLVGALSALGAVLPPPIELRQAPRWDFEDGWQVALDGRAVVKPWLILLDIAAYVVRQLSSRPASDRRLAEQGSSALP